MLQGLFGNASEVDPYKSISHFSVETAGTFDMDSELKIYISGNMNPFQREFKRGGTAEDPGAVCLEWAAVKPIAK